MSRQDAVAWLESTLQEGPKSTKDLYPDALAAGISERSLRRARETLGISVVRGSHEATWTLPEPTPDSLSDLTSQLTTTSDDDLVLDHFVERQRIRARHKRKRHTVTKFHLGYKPVAFVFLSDQHTGSPGTHVERVVSDARLIAATEGCYCANLGDTINNFIVGRLAAKGATQDDAVQDQRMFLRAYIRTLLTRPYSLTDTAPLKWWVTGNHELWTMGMVNLDPEGELARQMNVCYDKYEMAGVLQVGSQEYLIHSRHKFKGHSMHNDLHANIRYYNEGDHTALGDRHPDIVVLGHKHCYAYLKQQRNGKLRTYISPGSYKVEDSYGRSLGFQDALPNMGVVVLRPDRHRVEIHEDLEFVCKEYLPWLRR